MGRSPCCDKVGLKKGPWTPEEDQKLLAYIEEHGQGSWRALPPKAGLQRCGKSCRLRWTNYLRPDIKRGKFSLQEEQTIIQLHALLGNRWSAIATHLPKRTDNEIKNYWNTHLKKRLTKMGIDPVTHKSKNDTLLSSDGLSKNAANLSHIAQWESARLEAEARLVRESKLRNNSHSSLQHHNLGLTPGFPSSSSSSSSSSSCSAPSITPSSSSLEAMNKSWNIATRININNTNGGGGGGDLESPTSTLSYSEAPIMTSERGRVKEEGYEREAHLEEYKDGIENSMPFSSSLHEMTLVTMENTWGDESLRTSASGAHAPVVEEGFTSLLLSTNAGGGRSLSSDGGGGGESSNNCLGSGNGNDNCSEFYEDNKNYWNSILNLVNYSPPPHDSPIF